MPNIPDCIGWVRHWYGHRLGGGAHACSKARSLIASVESVREGGGKRSDEASAAEGNRNPVQSFSYWFWNHRSVSAIAASGWNLSAIRSESFSTARRTMSLGQS